ncbi:MAG: HEAT repeat domain-containing protein [Mariprofundus sp.]|nr:HEAT repeat domain-containing protein [Mariprofundus sp.]
MGIFDHIIKRLHRSDTANKVSPVCHRLCYNLFNNEHIIATDLDALIDEIIASNDAGIETFQLSLANKHQPPRRHEQILDMLGAMKSPAPSPHAEKTIIALIACFLNGPQGLLAAKATEYLARYGAAATDLLLNALQHEHGRSRSHAARALANCDDKRITARLISALQDDDARVRSDVAESLGKLADPLAIEALIHALSDSNWLVRDSASVALAGFSDEIDQFSLLLQHENHQIRASAVGIIQRLKHQQVLPLLIAALDDPHPDVQRQAVEALSLFHKAIIPLLQHYHQSDIVLRQHIASACNKIGINRVATQLSNHEINIRIAVIHILAQLGCTGLLPLLADAWQHENNAEARTQIIIAIAQLTASAGENSPDSAITTLIQATKSSDQNIVYHARKALQSLPHPLAEQFMQPALQASEIAINCPSCLQTLQLKPPLTDKKWSCPHCHLSFSIHNGVGDVLMVTPLTATVQGATLPKQSAAWFEILQIKPDANVTTIKRSFRKLLKQYHPDKVDALGTEFKLLAEEKTRLLTWALRSGLKQRVK